MSTLVEQALPDITGAFARAWNPKVEPGNLDQTAAVDSWIVSYPTSHPFWPVYQFSVISLRDIPGIPPAHKKYPEAEFEFSIIALDPDGARGHPLATHDRESWRPLIPVNVTVQFDNGDDAPAAAETLALAVRYVCEKGVGIEPDDDSRVRPFWDELIRNTADHARGAHDPFPET